MIYIDLFASGPLNDEFPVNTVEANPSEVAEVVQSVVDNMPRNGIIRIEISRTTIGQCPMSADYFLDKVTH